MDDIYFSDKKKKSSADEPSSSKRFVSDRFSDADFDDTDIDINVGIEVWQEKEWQNIRY